MLPIIINGAAGRMGASLLQVCQSVPEVSIIGTVERSEHPYIGRDSGEVHGMPKNFIELTSDLGSCLIPEAIVIDFSTPEGMMKALSVCVNAGNAGFISGTTGISAMQQDILQKAALVLPVLYAPNMSPGVNMLFILLNQLKNMLPKDFDIEIVETHHRNKVDAPSGTAMRIVDILKKPQTEVCLGRKTKNGPRKPNQITLHSLRLGEIVGEHEIRMCSSQEELVIGHKALSRTVFARGALLAAEWIVGKEPGYYTFQNVLEDK